MKNLTNLLAFLLVLACLQTSIAQEKKYDKEVGIQISSLNLNDGFNGIYKRSMSASSYLRFRAYTVNTKLVSINGADDFTFCLGLAVGKEKRKVMDDRLMFFYGPEFGLGFGYATTEGGELTLQFSPRFGWVVGLQHSFNDKWALNIETIPSVSLSIIDAPEDFNDRILFDIRGASSVAIGMVRKF